MAKKTEEKKGPAVQTLDDIADALNRKCGQHTMSFNRPEDAKDPDRLPSGVFSIDFATGGGVPMWGSACLWGPESGGKTSNALDFVKMSTLICWKCFNLISNCQCSTNPLKMRSAWADIEGTLDLSWAHNIGVSVEDLAVILGDSAEQYLDICNSVLQADDLGLLVVDSLAGLSPSAEMEASSDDQFYALQARLIGRFVRNMKQRLIRERKREHPCTIIFINQMRTKIGQKFGSPETMSGGHGMKHEFSLVLRCSQLTLDKTKHAKYINSTREKPIANRSTFTVKKNKILTIAGAGEFFRMTEPSTELDLSAGQVDDYTTTLKYARDMGIVNQNPKGGWKYFKYSARTLNDIINVWKKKPSEYHRTQQAIIVEAKKRLKTCQL